MVSDMRSRVKTLEQRIQSRVPRMHKISLRVGDVDAANRASSESEKTAVESPGWVLVTQEATPVKHRGERATPPPSSFRPGASTLRPPSRVNSLSTSQMLSASTNSRPSSRTTSSGRHAQASVSPLGSRPVTPTLLPVPATSSDASKRPTRRSSLGASTTLKPLAARTRPNSTTMPSRPPLPSMHASPVTTTTTGRGVSSQHPPRPKSNLGMSSRNPLSMSKIGRPNSLTAPVRHGAEQGS